jgi:hypothetical protein
MNRARQTGVRLSRRFRSAQAFAVEPRAVEAARATLPGNEHRAGIFDPARARLWLFGGGNPVDPISARIGCDIRPQRARLRGSGRESFPQICRDRGFRFFCRGCDLEGDKVARVYVRRFRLLPLHFEPVTLLAVWPERGLKRDAIDGAFYRRHTARGKFRTSSLWQNEKGPGVALLALIGPRAGRLHCRAKEFRFETNLRSRLGHFA